MRILLGIFAVLLLAACQQPAGSTATPASGSSQLSAIGGGDFGAGKGERMRYFRTEGDAMSQELAVTLLDACYGKIQAQDKSGFQSCLRDRMTKAFDDSGQGRTACDHFSTLDTYADCMVVGNMVLNIRHRLDDDSPVDADFWTSKETMVHAMIKSVVIGATSNCRSGQSEAEIMSCADDWFAKRLALPDEYMRRCDANKNDDDRMSCMGEAVTLQYMRVHMDRMSKNAI